MLEVSTQHALAGYRDPCLCGVGATSRVYRAIDAATGRVVALKRLNRHLVRAAGSLVRFRRELDALRRVQHPGIVRVYDVVDWDGDPTLVMDFIEGVDLHELVAGRGPVTGDVASRIARELFDILAAAHGAGIVHRDVKPQNVRIRPDGSVILLDFGSARLDAASKLTATGTTVGTPEYMPPELFAGSAYDPRVDIYGVGATIFYALTGRAPHTAESLAELATLRNNTDAPPTAESAPDAPIALAQVIDRCLARDPAQRYSTAALATWALDHPDIEREFVARRSRHPSCLHCQARIAPESAVCSHCKSDRPFAYTPGLCHVEIVSVADPARFIEHVVTEFPEHGTPEGVTALAERCAALSFEAQRYVSFIDEADAQAVVATIAKSGVKAKTTYERPVVGRSLAAAFVAAVGFHFFFMAMSVFVLKPGSISYEALVDAHLGQSTFWLSLPAAVVGYLVSTLASLSRASGGVLGSGRRGAVMAPALRFLTAGAAFLVFVWASCAVLAAARWWPYGTSVKLGAIAASLAAVAAVVSWLWCERARFAHRAVKTKHSPEPPRWQKLASALFPSQALARATSTPKSTRLLAAAAAIVVLECCVLGGVWYSLEQQRLAMPKARSLKFAIHRVFYRYNRSYDWIFPSRRPREPTFVDFIRQDFSVVSTTLIVLACGFVTIAVSRRRRRIRADAAQMEAELDPELRVAVQLRTPPVTRQAQVDRGVGESFVLLDARDGFAQDAVSRAADLAHLLEPASRVRLETAIQAIAPRTNAPHVRERSLLARSILETDVGQKARFDFLELEGELEAEAAEEWWQRRRC